MLRGLTYIAKALPRGKPAPRSLEALADRMEGAFALSFTKGVKRFADSVNRDAMAKAVYSGKYDKVTEVVPWDKLPLALSEFDKTTAATALGGSSWGAKEIRAASGRMTRAQRDRAEQALLLTTQNPAIKQYVEERTGLLVTGITEQFRASVKRVVGAGSQAMASPRDLAADLIKNALPLGDRQYAALTRYSATVREDLGNTKKADILIDRYRAQLQSDRAMLVGRTESSMALNAGQQIVWQEAREQGLLPENAQREWVTESEPCDICADLNGQTVALDEPFVGSDGLTYEIPAHPACRCMQALVQVT